MKNMEILRACPLCANLTQRELDLVARLAGETTHPERTRLIEEGKPCDSLYVIMEGSVELKGRSSDGTERTIAVLGSKDCFGEGSLAGPGASMVTAEATMGSARVLRIGADALKRLIHQVPEIGSGLLAAAFLRLQRMQRLAILQG